MKLQIPYLNESYKNERSALKKAWLYYRKP